jgi:hypothetical protein
VGEGSTIYTDYYPCRYLTWYLGLNGSFSTRGLSSPDSLGKAYLLLRDGAYRTSGRLCFFDSSTQSVVPIAESDRLEAAWAGKALIFENTAVRLYATTGQ